MGVGACWLLGYTGGATVAATDFTTYLTAFLAASTSASASYLASTCASGSGVSSLSTVCWGGSVEVGLGLLVGRGGAAAWF